MTWDQSREQKKTSQQTHNPGPGYRVEAYAALSRCGELSHSVYSPSVGPPLGDRSTCTFAHLLPHFRHIRFGCANSATAQTPRRRILPAGFSKCVSLNRKFNPSSRQLTKIANEKCPELEYSLTQVGHSDLLTPDARVPPPMDRRRGDLNKKSDTDTTLKKRKMWKKANVSQKRHRFWSVLLGKPIVNIFGRYFRK